MTKKSADCGGGAAVCGRPSFCYNRSRRDRRAGGAAVCYDDAASPEGFIAFNMQNVRLNAASKQVGANGGLLVQFPYQAILKVGGTGTAFDQSTLTIQRSNA
jgi:hypothetical protein